MPDAGLVVSAQLSQTACTCKPRYAKNRQLADDDAALRCDLRPRHGNTRWSTRLDPCLGHRWPLPRRRITLRSREIFVGVRSRWRASWLGVRILIN